MNTVEILKLAIPALVAGFVALVFPIFRAAAEFLFLRYAKERQALLRKRRLIEKNRRLKADIAEIVKSTLSKSLPLADRVFVLCRQIENREISPFKAGSETELSAGFDELVGTLTQLSMKSSFLDACSNSSEEFQALAPLIASAKGLFEALNAQGRAVLKAIGPPHIEGDFFDMPTHAESSTAALQAFKAVQNARALLDEKQRYDDQLESEELESDLSSLASKRNLAWLITAIGPIALCSILITTGLIYVRTKNSNEPAKSVPIQVQPLANSRH